MLHLPKEQSQKFAESLPAATLTFLAETGVPESIVLRGIEHGFTLDMQPRLDGAAFRVGQAEDAGLEIAVERSTGHLGYVATESGQPPWIFANTSLAQFFACFEASERVWRMEAAREIKGKARGRFLEREIRRIDPVVFDDPDNIWAFLVEELREGVV